MQSTRPDYYRYPAFLGYDEPTGQYYVLWPDLPGCTTQGRTEAETLDNAIEAMAGHLACMEDCGEDIPASSEPASLQPDDGEKIVFIEAWTPSFRVTDERLAEA